ncbi:MAG: hypothetical protein ACD_80C00103G0003, partial [uncultured bacterium (gcode 4)]
MKISTYLKEHLELHNTLSRVQEKFVPIVRNKVGLYTCGPTVYSRAHIGNFRAYLFADTLKRTLLKAGYQVTHVMNITDVGELAGGDGEDKMLLGAKKENITAWEVAKKYTKLFVQDRESLHILPSTITCNATDHIKEQIALVKKLETNGYTYKTDDGIYFDTSKLSDYGKLAKLDIKGLEAGSRVEMGQKKNKTDFALWKFSAPGETRDMEWASPWGKGFPGWHIECSAMSMKYLGEQFDIHTGGIDHIPVHHTNEIAQTEGATGKKPFVRYWMHLNFLNFGEEKMSKSIGNIKDLDELSADGIEPMAFRYLCLTAKYRQSLTANNDAFTSAQVSFSKLRSKIHELFTQTGIDLQKPNTAIYSDAATDYVYQYYSALANDLNTPIALAVIWTMIKDANVSDQEKVSLLLDFDDTLGLNIQDFVILKESKIPKSVLDLVKQRQEYKQTKQWDKSDEIRHKIEALGYEILDKNNSFIVRKKGDLS